MNKINESEFYKQYMQGIFKEFKISNCNITQVEKVKLTERVKKELLEDVVWDDMLEYFETAQYNDKYGLFDAFPDKENVIQSIYKLYNLGCQIRFLYLMDMEYSQFINYGKITKEQKLDNTLDYLYLHLKRGVLKVRVVSEKESKTRINKEGKDETYIDYIKYIEYNSKNANLILTDFKERYLNAEDRDWFAEWEVEVILSENEWK